jgi:hypothetical protein
MRWNQIDHACGHFANDGRVMRARHRAGDAAPQTRAARKVAVRRVRAIARLGWISTGAIALQRQRVRGQRVSTMRGRRAPSWALEREWQPTCDVRGIADHRSKWFICQWRFAVKRAFIAMIFGVVVLGAIGIPTSHSWAPPVDARPEAVAAGSTLLVLASFLRRGLPTTRRDR